MMDDIIRYRWRVIYTCLTYMKKHQSNSCRLLVLIRDYTRLQETTNILCADLFFNCLEKSIVMKNVIAPWIKLTCIILFFEWVLLKTYFRGNAYVHVSTHSIFSSSPFSCFILLFIGSKQLTYFSGYSPLKFDSTKVRSRTHRPFMPMLSTILFWFWQPNYKLQFP